MLGQKIQNFLQRKLVEYNLIKKELAAQSGILYQSILDILNFTKLNPALTTITRIADYFNCLIDEVIGRKVQYDKNIEIKHTNSTEFNNNLKNYIRTSLEKKGLNPYKVSTDIGFNISAIVKFIKEGSTQKSLGSDIVVALANYLNVSLDQMTVRVEANQVKYLGGEVNQGKITESDRKLDKVLHLQKIAKDIKDVKKDAKTILQCLSDKELLDKENDKEF